MIDNGTGNYIFVAVVVAIFAVLFTWIWTNIANDQPTQSETYYCKIDDRDESQVICDVRTKIIKTEKVIMSKEDFERLNAD